MTERAASSWAPRVALTSPGARGTRASLAVAGNLLTADAARPGSSTPRSRRLEERSATCRPAATTFRRRHRRRRKSTARRSSQATTRHISDGTASPTTPAAGSMVVSRPGGTTSAVTADADDPVADDTAAGPPRNTPTMMITVSSGSRGDAREHSRENAHVQGRCRARDHAW